jgi:hypothetical protein
MRRTDERQDSCSRIWRRGFPRTIRAFREIGIEAKLYYIDHTLMENRNGLLVDA